MRWRTWATQNCDQNVTPRKVVEAHRKHDCCYLLHNKHQSIMNYSNTNVLYSEYNKKVNIKQSIPLSAEKVSDATQLLSYTNKHPRHNKI